MPRKLREREEQAFHHVYARGNRRGAVFHDDDDRRWFLARLFHVEKETRTLHGAHCLMPNHVHLMVQPGPAGISRLLQHVLGPYTQWFNRRHGCVGHVFQGRFGSRVIESDEDLLHILRYIHRNPVEAGMVPAPELWKWSSHPDHLRPVPPPYLREVAPFVRTRLSEDPDRALVLYRRLIESPDGELLLACRGESEPPRPADELEGTSNRPNLGEISRRVECRFSLEVGTIRGPGRKRRQSEARRAFCLAAIRNHQYTLTEVAAFLGRSLSNVSVLLRNAG